MPHDEVDGLPGRVRVLDGVVHDACMAVQDLRPGEGTEGRIRAHEPAEVRVFWRSEGDLVTERTRRLPRPWSGISLDHVERRSEPPVLKAESFK